MQKVKNLLIFLVTKMGLLHHRIETTGELWELADRCARAEEGVRVPEEEEPEDKVTPAKSKKRDPGPDKRVFVTETPQEGQAGLDF